MSRSSFYKNFIYGNSGKDYIKSHYPRILINIIKHFREEVLFIVTRDINTGNHSNIVKCWSNITINTLSNKRKFQILPSFKLINAENYLVEFGDNNQIQLYLILIPKSLEYQIAMQNMIKDKLIVPNEIQNNDHEFLKYISELKNCNVEELIKSSITLLIQQIWLISISKLIKNFDIS